MQKHKTHLIDVYYDKIRATAYYSKTYKLLEEHASIFQNPTFTISNLKPLINDLTYRKINDWNSKKLISGNRNKKSGWRRFSIIDIVILNIISDLKKLGFSSDIIRKILKRLTEGTLVTEKFSDEKIKTHKFLELEFFIFDSYVGNKNLLIIKSSGDILFMPERAAMDFYFSSDNAAFPLVILPLFDYVRKIFSAKSLKIDIKVDSMLKELFDTQLSEKEKKIIEIIRNGKYEEILIKKPNEKSISIKASSKKSGEFSDKEILNVIKKKQYQNVKVITDSGRVISIIQEEKFRV